MDGSLKMPLVQSKSDAAFRKNVKAELAAGREPKQAVAISYTVKRAAEKKTPPNRSK